MRLFCNTPIKRKLTIISLLTSGAALVLACAAFVTYDQVSVRTTLVRDLSITGRMIGYNCAAALSFNEPGSAESTLQSLAAQPHIISACIYGIDGRVFAHYRRTGEKNTPWPAAREDVEHFTSATLELFRAIQFNGERIGSIYIESDLVEIHQRWQRYVGISAAVLLATTLLAWAIAARLQGIISGPVSHLADIADRVATGKNYSLRATRHGDDELGRGIL